MKTSDRLKGLRALITGASFGLGRATARAFWNAGADVVLVARSKKTLDDVHAALGPRAGQSAHVVVADLADPAAPRRVLDAFHEHFDRVDALVNIAGIQGPIGPVWLNDWKAWEETIRVNLLAPVALCRLCVPEMIEARRGKIINISGGGAATPRGRVSAYATAKAGLVRFSETLAEETSEWGICVNCLAPGAMKSSQTQSILDAGRELAGEREFTQVSKIFATGGTSPDLPAQVCVFFASAEGDGITGKLISAVWDPWEDLRKFRGDLAGTDIYTLRRIVPKDRGKTWGDRPK